MLKQKKKIFYAILLIVYLLNSFVGIVSAAQISSAEIVNLGDCGYHLQYWNEDKNTWSYIITTMAGYYYNGELHYAYCMQAERDGVGEIGLYDLSINDLLDDVQIWRTITAGFPYRSASQLGCYTDEDAFVATKQAVYCIIYGFDPETRYNGGDERGDAIKEAIINLVNEGRYGTRSQTNADVSINKVDDLIVDNDYCYQEYSVSSFVNISLYTITATNGLPEGSKIVNMNNDEQATFNGNEHFKVQIPRNKIVDNIDATILIRTKCETFPIFYGNSPSSSMQDYALTFDPLGDEQGITNLNIDINKSSIKVIKQDSLKKYKIPGVVFNFKYENGEEIGNFTTDKNGEIIVNNLRPGKVIAKEVQTDENYILDTTEKEINLKYADNVVISIENELKTGQIKVIKVDQDNHEIKLEGVKIGVYDEDNNLLETIVTNSKGEALTQKYYLRDYKQLKLVELETKQEYILNDEPKTIKLEENQIKDVVFENKIKPNDTETKIYKPEEQREKVLPRTGR